MAVIHENEAQRIAITPGRERYQACNESLMVVVIDFNDGPGAEPDPPHQHPHEQITYVAEGELRFFVGEDEYRVGAGDLVTIPPNTPHTVQLISVTARLVDSFHTIREDFLEGK